MERVAPPARALRRSLAGGVASSLRTAVRPTPLFVTSGTGSRLHDVDGNEYVDYVMAYGPLILGHAHPEVVAAVGEAAARGSTFGSQHEDEIAVAERVCTLCPERRPRLPHRQRHRGSPARLASCPRRDGSGSA